MKTIDRTRRREREEKKSRYMHFLNYSVSKSIGAVSCFIVWAVTKKEELDRLRVIRQEML